MKNKYFKSFAFFAAALSVIMAVHSAGAEDKAPEPFVITLENGKFTPEELVIPADQKVKIIVKNMNKKAAEFESHSLHREKIIGPGKQAVILVGPLKAGTHDYFDEFHEESTGKITVK